MDRARECTKNGAVSGEGAGGVYGAIDVTPRNIYIRCTSIGQHYLSTGKNTKFVHPPLEYLHDSEIEIELGVTSMIRRIVACPSCELHFLSARPKTFCPGCHQMVEPKVVDAA